MEGTTGLQSRNSHGEWLTGGWRARRGAILACFGDAKPSNDFESTRLVARIIQFEYVYRACGANGPRAYIRVPIGARVIPAYIYNGRILYTRFSRSPNIDITIESPSLLLVAPRFTYIVSFSFMYLATFPISRARLPRDVSRGMTGGARVRIHREWIIGYRARSPYFNLSL